MPPDQAMIVAFVRMAGESRPWGIAWGTVGVRADGSSRCRTAVCATTSPFSARRSPRTCSSTCGCTTGRSTRRRRSRSSGDLRQVWLPNGQHVAMLHQLSYTYSQTKFGGDEPGHPARAGPRRGLDVPRHLAASATSMSSAPASCSATPTSSRRRMPAPHTSAIQLAWLTTPGDRDARIAAAARSRRAHRLADDGSRRLSATTSATWSREWQAGSARRATTSSEQADAIAASSRRTDAALEADGAGVRA